MLHRLIGQKSIGVDRTPGLDVSANLRLHMVFPPSGNHVCANLSATFQNPDDWSFVLASGCGNPAMVLLAVHVPRRASDKGFIHFHFAPMPTKFQNRAILHCEPDAMEHEPCGLLSDAECAGHFVGTDAVLAVGNHPHSDEPFVEWKRRILKDCPDLDRELLAGMLALAFPHVPSRDVADFFAPASGAFDTMRPATLHHELAPIIGIRAIVA